MYFGYISTLFNNSFSKIDFGYTLSCTQQNPEAMVAGPEFLHRYVGGFLSP